MLDFPKIHKTNCVSRLRRDEILGKGPLWRGIRSSRTPLRGNGKIAQFGSCSYRSRHSRRRHGRRALQWSLMWNMRTARLQLRLQGANSCSTWELLCQTELQEPLHCKYLGTQRPSKELRTLEKVDSMFTFLPVDSREYGSARVFRPGTRAVHSGHAE